MNIATILFTYNRPEHTEKVLEALSKNEILPEKLFIFQDGKKDITDKDKWHQVNELIKSVDWCETEVHVAEKSKGCARSIIDGINYVLDRYDATVILEDDCKPHPQFMTFMYSALHKYENEKKVYSLSGYAYAVYLDADLYDEDAYFSGRTCSWGWATWKDRWCQFEEDYSILRRIESDPVNKEALQIWGPDLEDMLLGNIDGRCDAWDVFWSLKVIEKGGVCLSPFKSLIENIGLDGSGTHSGTIRIDIEQQAVEEKKDFVLPDKTECSSECEREFQMYFSRTSRIKSLEMTRELLCKCLISQSVSRTMTKFEPDVKMAIWGKGILCDLLLDTVLKKNNIACIVESYPRVNVYRDIPVVTCSELPEDVELVIVVPFWDMEKIQHLLHKEGIKVNVKGMDEILLNS